MKIQRVPWQQRKWPRSAYLVGLIQSMSLMEKAHYYQRVQRLRLLIWQESQRTEWT